MRPWICHHGVIDYLEGVPGRGTEHPRAFALAPGGDSGAVPTTMATRAGGRLATPNGRRHPPICASAESISMTCPRGGALPKVSKPSNNVAGTFISFSLSTAQWRKLTTTILRPTSMLWIR